jgi:ATP-dependent protease Clp ATPase subunit
MLDVMYDIPHRRNIAEVIIHDDVFENRAPPLIIPKEEKESA